MRRSPRPAREHQSEQSKDGAITVAKISMLSAVVVALISAAATVVTFLIKDDRTNAAASPPPDTTMQGDMPSSRPTTPRDDNTRDIPTPDDGAQVKFFFPQEGSKIDVGQDVLVSGSVTGLGSDTLWILSRHDVGGSFYLVPPTITQDGPWSVTDENVGDPLDKGSNFVYYAVQANAECTKALSSMDIYDSFREIPKGCTARDQRHVRVR